MRDYLDRISYGFFTVIIWMFLLLILNYKFDSLDTFWLSNAIVFAGTIAGVKV